MTEGPGPHPARPPSTSPFDEAGRLINGRRGPVTGSLTQTPPGTAMPGSPDPRAGEPGFGNQPPPLNWVRSGPIPLGFSGAIPLSGGLTLGRPRRKRQTVSGFDPVVRGRGLARFSSRPQPTTAGELQRATVRWVVALWVMVVVLQRFGLGVVSILLPLSLAWCVYGLVRGVLEPDRYRFGWWLAAAGATALIAPLQGAFSPSSQVSLTSWGELMLTFLVFVFRLRDRRRSTYLKVLQGIFRAELWHATLIIGFLASQIVIPYQDWPATFVPSSFLLHGYTLAYPFSYGSTFYRSNGWIGLETSFTSMQLALGVIVALLLRKKLLVVLFLLAAIACTGALSGVEMLAAAVVIMLISPMRWALARYSVMVPTVVAFLLSPLGTQMVSRLTEGTSSNTSTGERTTAPYQIIWPQWSTNPLWVLLGRGAGSSQRVIDGSGVHGAIVPTPVKLFFDFGVVAGLVLAVFLLFMNLGGPSRALAAAMVSGYWLFQPGTQILLVITVPIFISWWTPRGFSQLENDHVPSPNAAIAPENQRRPRTELLT